jgi:DNA-directed RNA polymerase specialized sigma subunit
MAINKEQLLRNPNMQPTDDVIAKALGESNDAYIKFINEIASHDIHLD